MADVGVKDRREKQAEAERARARETKQKREGMEKKELRI